MRKRARSRRRPRQPSSSQPRKQAVDAAGEQQGQTRRAAARGAPARRARPLPGPTGTAAGSGRAGARPLGPQARRTPRPAWPPTCSNSMNMLACDSMYAKVASVMRSQPFAGVPLLGGDGLQRAHELAGPLLDQRAEDALLAVEVVVQRPRGQPRPLGHVGHLGVGEPLLAEHRLGGVQDGPADDTPPPPPAGTMRARVRLALVARDRSGGEAAFMPMNGAVRSTGRSEITAIEAAVSSIRGEARQRQRR